MSFLTPKRRTGWWLLPAHQHKLRATTTIHLSNRNLKRDSTVVPDLPLDPPPLQPSKNYQISFIANCICLDVVEVAVNAPAEASGASVWANTCQLVAVGGLKFV